MRQGRGRSKNHELGLCPATTDSKLDGVHEGENSGRACWAIAGSMCGGKIHGSFAQKYGNCVICDFFKKVIRGGGLYPFINST